MRQYGNLLRFLIAFMIYYDGLVAVIGFGGIYAAGIFGWGTTELGIFGILLNVIAIPAVIAGGWLDDRFGSKRAVQFAIVAVARSEEHTSELQSLMRISYAVFCLKKKTHTSNTQITNEY